MTVRSDRARGVAPVDSVMAGHLPFAAVKAPAQLRPRLIALGLGAALAVAFALRVFLLGEKSFWLDEGTSFAIASLSGRELWDALMNRGTNMVLYFGLLHYWLGLGTSEATIRLLSVIPSVATVAVLYRLGTRLFGTRVGLIAAALLAVNAYHIRYAQEARSYSFLVLFVTLSFLFLARALEQPARREWVAYAASTVLAVYSHAFALLVLPSQWISLLFLRRREVPWRGLLISKAVTLVLVAPFVGFAIFRDVEQLDWIREPDLVNIAGVFQALSGLGGVPLLLAYLACASLGLAAAVTVWRSRGRSPAAWAYGVLPVWLAVPIAIVYIVSIIGKPVFFHRYLIVSLPPLILLAAVGLGRLRGWALVAALIMLVALAGRGVAGYYALDKGEWRPATRYILTHARARDAMVFFPVPVRRPFDYYVTRYPAPQSPEVVFPDQAVYWRATAEPSEDLLKDLALRYERVWLVVPPDWRPGPTAGSRRIQATLAHLYPAVTPVRFRGVRVYLYERHGR